MAPDATYTLADQELMSGAPRYFAWQSRLVLPHLGRRVIEIGCGIGNFTSMLLDRELVVAVDVEPACVERLRKRYPDRPNLRTLVCHDIGRLARFVPDSIVCLNVLEHVEDDAAMLRQMASILPPGGTVVLLVPAFPTLYGPIDWNLGHHRRYTRKAVLTLAEATGFRVRVAQYMNMAGFFGWWWNGHVSRREAQSAAQIEFFDRVIVPVLARVEGLIPPPFGQSLLAVLERSACLTWATRR